MAKKPSVKAFAGKKLDELEKYALTSLTLRKITAGLYRSNLYIFFSKKVNEFRNYNLCEEVKRRPVPKHVAIIMDGNRRFAQTFDLKPEAGHYLGRDKIEEVLEWCFDLGIHVLTIYAFSVENFNRRTEEVNTLMDLFRDELRKAKTDSRIHKNQVRIRVLGHLDSLPEDIRTSAEEIMDATKQYSKYALNIAIAYGGREEIVHAIQRIASDVQNKQLNVDAISEKTVSSYLYTNGLPDPDLILRTSGEERISNFLLWQLAYSELYFSDVYWPAFQQRDFLEAIRTYQNRKRRFGT